MDRGGRRGTDALPVFPASAGHEPQTPLKTDGAFPFKVAIFAKDAQEKKRDNLLIRKWASLSEGWASWKNPDLAGRTGVLFQPSRMAGDRYQVTVYLCCETKDFDDKDDTVSLDTDAAAPLIVSDKIKKSSGIFTIWRELNLVKYLKKTAAPPITSIVMNTVSSDFASAYLRLTDDTGGVGYMDAGTYNTTLTGAIAAYPDWEFQLMVNPATNQYAAGARFIYYRSHAEWKTAVQAKITAEGWTVPQTNAWKMTPNGAMWADIGKYHEHLKSFAMTLYPQVADAFMSADEGINTFQFEYTHNQPGGTSLLGFAVAMPNPVRDKCGFILCDSDASYAGTLDTRENTMSHEIGHHLFLPHTWQVSPAHDPEKSHDRGDTACTMSYEQQVIVKFCGFCLLRMRGWSKFATSADGTPTAATRTLTETSASNKKLSGG